MRRLRDEYWQVLQEEKVLEEFSFLHVFFPGNNSETSQKQLLWNIVLLGSIFAKYYGLRTFSKVFNLCPIFLYFQFSFFSLIVLHCGYKSHSFFFCCSGDFGHITTHNITTLSITHSETNSYRTFDSRPLSNMFFIN